MKFDCGFTKDNEWFRYRAAAIIIENGCVLFAKNDRDDYYYSIGGGVHIGEKAEDAVIREVYEETGIYYEIDRLAFIHEHFFTGSGSLEGYNCHEMAFYFLMKPRGTQQLNSNSYVGGYKEHMHWLPINDLANYKAYPTFFIDKLSNIPKYVEHIVTDERLIQSGHTQANAWMNEGWKVKCLELGKSVVFAKDKDKNNRTLKIGKKYRHFKGKEYRVLHIAKHSETLEAFVVYQALYGEKGIWVRPLDMFLEQVEVDGKLVNRFEECDE